MIDTENIRGVCQLSHLDVFFTVLAGAAHDMDHPGNNNMFETKTQSKLAMLYNDFAVLEMHHAASFFFLLENMKHDCNVLSDLSPSERADARSQILDYILATDMSKHAEIQKSVQ